MRDRRPQKHRRRIGWNTLRSFWGREQSRCLRIIRRSRKVNVGQAPNTPHTGLASKPCRRAGCG